MFQTDQTDTASQTATSLLERESNDRPLVFDAVAGLAGCGMIRWDGNNAPVSVHRVIQYMMRVRDTGPSVVTLSRRPALVREVMLFHAPDNTAESVRVALP